MPLDGVAFAAAILLVVAVIGVAIGLRAFLTREGVIERRLKATTESGPEYSEASAGVVAKLAESLGPMARAARPLNEEEMGRLKLQLTKAGFRAEYAVQLFLASKIALALLSALGFLWINSRRAEPFEPSVLLAVTLFAAGYYLPTVWLGSRVRTRQAMIERGLPDT